MFDLGLGGGPSATQNTTTLSGNAKQTGKGSLYTESGSIGVGTKGTYTEGGGYNLSGLKLAKGSSLTINESPLNSDALANIFKMFGGNTTPTAAGNSAPTTDSSTPASTSDSTLADRVKTWFAGLSTMQKLGGAVVIVLIAWLLFHPRK
jgi:hypothetical protein